MNIKIYYLIFVTSILMGFLVGYSFVYVSKFKDYIEAKKKFNKTMLITVIDILWRLLLVIPYASILILPAYLLPIFIDDDIILKNCKRIFLYSYTCSFFLCLFILIKLKKIETE